MYPQAPYRVFLFFDVSKDQFTHHYPLVSIQLIALLLFGSLQMFSLVPVSFAGPACKVISLSTISSR